MSSTKVDFPTRDQRKRVRRKVLPPLLTGNILPYALPAVVDLCPCISLLPHFSLLLNRDISVHSVSSFHKSQALSQG